MMLCKSGVSSGVSLLEEPTNLQRDNGCREKPDRDVRFNAALAGEVKENLSVSDLLTGFLRDRFCSPVKWY